MLSMQTVSFMAIPAIRLDNNDIIYTPSLIKMMIENEFMIPGMMFRKNRSRNLSYARFLFGYILNQKMKLSPEMITKLYGIKHDSLWYGNIQINNILETRTPKHYYIKIDKLIKKVRRWEIDEIIPMLELNYVNHASAKALRKSTLERCIRVAQSTKQKPVLTATEPEELKLQPE